MVLQSCDIFGIVFGSNSQEVGWSEIVSAYVILFCYKINWVISSFRTVITLASRRNIFNKADFIPMALPLAMLIFGNGSLLMVMKVWIQILIFSSFLFGLIGLNAGHHHPEAIHEGDKLRYAWSSWFSKKCISRRDEKIFFISHYKVNRTNDDAITYRIKYFNISATTSSYVWVNFFIADSVQLKSGIINSKL